MINLEMKLGPCPKCGGRPVIDSRCQWHDGQEDFTVKCLDCGLELDYSHDPYYIPHTSIKWSYNEFADLSLDAVWNREDANDG